MRKYASIAILISFLSLGMQTVFADEMPANAMPLSKILENLQSKGYTVFREIEFQNGLYVTKAFNSQGENLKIRINPQTGEIVEPKAKATTLSLLDIAKKLENAGYHGISKIGFDRGEYEAIALDKDGKKVDLDIDGKTGEINKDWF
ncbi:MAG TPA: PepSY domain-containing protein [Gammaproteobacteria bacterium]|nr:PepSY domain-containing protein [Gammaproteobacteria bacterium]